MATRVEIIYEGDGAVGVQSESTAKLLSWEVKDGDVVKIHQVLAEVETSKTALEIAAPAGGVVNLAVEAGQEISTGDVLGYILTTEAVGSAEPKQEPPSRPEPIVEAPEEDSPSEPDDVEEEEEEENDDEPAPTPEGPPAPKVADDQPLSPAVKRLLREHNLNANDVPTSGVGGRLTRDDVINFIERRSAEPEEEPEQEVEQPSGEVETEERASDTVPAVEEAEEPAVEAEESVTETDSSDDPPPYTPEMSEAPAVSRDTPKSRKIPHSPMRKVISGRIVESVSKAPHVSNMFELDLTRVKRHCEIYKPQFAEEGFKLSYTCYFIYAAARAMQTVPELNAHYYEDHIEQFEDVNIGIVVALDSDGLLIPVIKRAQELSLRQIARNLQDLVQGAQNRTLKGDDMVGCTFTISNYGPTGSLLAAPVIINPPEVAILGIGKETKRPKVIETDGGDAIVIAPQSFGTLTMDHRAVDAFQTGLWIKTFSSILATFPDDI